MSKYDPTLFKLAQQAVKEAMLKQADGQAFLPMPGGQPPMDPAAAGGMPPGMDPSMMAAGGMPPGMDPSMGGAMPPGMDPSMAGGMPPGADPSMMDPAAAGGAPAPEGEAAPEEAAADPAAQAAAAGLDANTIALLIPIIKNAVTEAIQAHGGGDKKDGKKDKKESIEDRVAKLEGGGAAPAAAAPAPAVGGSIGGAPMDPATLMGAPAAPPAGETKAASLATKLANLRAVLKKI